MVRVGQICVWGRPVLRSGPIAWALGVLLAGGVLMPVADADIRNTAHNLAKSGDAEVSVDDTCVFCHTPRVSLAENGATPQGQIATWQRSLARDFQFPAAEPVSSMAQPGDGPLSLVCLTCHDGNQAPFDGGMHQNHPVGVPFRGYARAAAPGRNAGFAAPMQADAEEPGKAEKNQPDDYSAAGSALVGDSAVWWVSTSGSTRRGRDDLPLYARTMPDGERLPNVECSSCHDPHNTSSMFLRMSNQGSRLCMTCHTL